MSPAGAGRVVRMLSNTVLGNRDYREMVLDAPELAAAARPGQFVHVRLPGAIDPFLRRPFSVAGADGGRLSIVYKRVGRLTSRMATLRPGAELDVFGPRGHGYRLEPPVASHAILAGGGYGAAPLLYLARALRDLKLATRITLLVGAGTASEFLWGDRLEAEASWLEAAFATDDGSHGFKGTVLDLLETRLPRPATGVRLCACGPMAMLAGLAKRWPAVRAEVAAEARMGCGMGVCQGCVLPMRGGAGVSRYARICRDGPVFDARRVDWPAALEA